MSPRSFLEIDDLEPDEVARVLDLAEDRNPPRVLANQGVALVFEKPSNRTRNSTEMAVFQLGGHPVSISAAEVGIDTRETAEDVARTLAGYHAAIGARVFAHSTLERMAAVSRVPIVNLLSDDSHPCQALADLLTMRQHFGKLEGLRTAWIGDFTNVARSLAIGCALTGGTFATASPPGYGPTDTDVDRLRALGLEPLVTTRPEEAVEGADAVHTDVWTSMGQELEAAARRVAFEGFTVDDALVDKAASGAVVLHCLPAHRGEEITASVVDGERSLVWQQAENRMHAVRGLLLFLLGGAWGASGTAP